jgi:hypothetical protein
LPWPSLTVNPFTVVNTCVISPLGNVAHGTLLFVATADNELQLHSVRFDKSTLKLKLESAVRERECCHGPVLDLSMLFPHRD